MNTLNHIDEIVRSERMRLMAIVIGLIVIVLIVVASSERAEAISGMIDK
jgi:hypothetical protein